MKQNKPTFFGKYWMYICIIIVVLINITANMSQCDPNWSKNRCTGEASGPAILIGLGLLLGMLAGKSLFNKLKNKK